MQQQSNTYIILFAVGLTIVIGGLLSITSVSLKPLQDKQVELDTKKKILSAFMDITPYQEDPNQVLEIYSQKVKSYVVDYEGNPVTKDRRGGDLVAEKVNVAKNSKLPAEERFYPVFQAMDGDNVIAYIFPMHGQGLWDWINGFIALESDLNTIMGVSFDHKTETPGLGARIASDQIQDRYLGKKIYNQHGNLVSVEMIKGEKGDPLDDHHVDGMSGATLTGNGVNAMLMKYLTSYQNFFNKVKSGGVAVL
ncbi:MAG: NADH:ubiquinone reductase (Na(+)-transporting) subunit C [Cyclobacteriaceae bacterium]